MIWKVIGWAVLVCIGACALTVIVLGVAYLVYCIREYANKNGEE